MAIIYFISTGSSSRPRGELRYQILQHFKLTNGITGGAREALKAKESSTERGRSTNVWGTKWAEENVEGKLGMQRWLCNSYINIFGQLCRPAETDQLGTRGEGGIPTLTLQYWGSPTIPHSCAAYITAAAIERGVLGKWWHTFHLCYPGSCLLTLCLTSSTLGLTHPLPPVDNIYHRQPSQFVSICAWFSTWFETKHINRTRSRSWELW